jgi:excisionase family DNA binding protein
MPPRCNSAQEDASILPLRFEIREAARILRMSRAQLYNRINDGAIKPHKDGARTYITRAELERYVDGCPGWARTGAMAPQVPETLRN